MSINQSYVIYCDSTHTWFFLIPEQADLPDGDFTIISLIGREMQVDPWAVEPYAVPRAMAEDYLSQQMRQGFDQMMESVTSFWRTVRDNRSQEERPNADETRWNVDFLADLFDQPPEAVRPDAEAAKQGLQDLFVAGATFFERVKSGDEEQLAAARQQVAEFADLLHRHGVQVDEAICDLPNQLAAVYINSQDEPERADSHI